MAAQRKQGQGTTNRGTGNRTGQTGFGSDMLYAAGQSFGIGAAHGILNTLGPNWPQGQTGQTGTQNMPARAKRGSRKQSQAQT